MQSDKGGREAGKVDNSNGFENKSKIEETHVKSDVNKKGNIAGLGKRKAHNVFDGLFGPDRKMNHKSNQPTTKGQYIVPWTIYSADRITYDQRNQLKRYVPPCLERSARTQTRSIDAN